MRKRKKEGPRAPRSRRVREQSSLHPSCYYLAWTCWQTLPCSQNGRSRWLSRGSTRSGILFSELKTRFPQSVKALKVERGIDLPKKGKLRMGASSVKSCLTERTQRERVLAASAFYKTVTKKEGLRDSGVCCVPGSPKVTCNRVQHPNKLSPEMECSLVWRPSRHH